MFIKDMSIIELKQQLQTELKKALQSNTHEHIKKAFNACHELFKQNKGLGAILIHNLNITESIEIELGDVAVPIKIEHITGSGKLIFKNTLFSEKVEICNCNSFNKGIFYFNNCTFEKPLQITAVANADLQVVVENDTSKNFKLLLIKSNIKRVRLKKCILKEFEYNEDCHLKHLSIKDSEIACRLMRNFTYLLGLKTFVVVNSKITTSQQFQDCKNEIATAIYFNKVQLFTNVEKTNTNVNFQRIVKFINTAVNEKTVLRFDSFVFRKPVYIEFIGPGTFISNASNFQISSKLKLNEFSRFEVNSSHFYGTNQFVLTNCKSTMFTSNNLNGDTSFNNSTFKLSDFQKNKFNSFLSFKKCTFDVAPNFTGSTFTNHTTFHGCKFKDIQSKESEGRYRLLKSKMKEINNDADEILFSSYELESRQKDLWPSDKTEYFFSILYKITNQYGRSIIQPLMAIFTIWLIFLFLFYSTDSFYIERHAKTPLAVQITEIKPPEPINDLTENYSWIVRAQYKSKAEQSAIFSGINMLGPLRLVSFFEGFKVKKFRYVLLTWFQSILATILWYLFIVGIKRRFRTG